MTTSTAKNLATENFASTFPIESSLASMSISDTEGESHFESFHRPSLPLHLELDDADFDYYRVVYRGVVALVTQPYVDAKRSGTYLSYGEVFSSRKDEGTNPDIIMENQRNGKATPNLSSTHNELPLSFAISLKNETLDLSSDKVSSVSHEGTNGMLFNTKKNLYTKALRVDRILTGGYAIDAGAEELEYIHSNDINSIVDTRAYTDSKNDKLHTQPTHLLGYIFSTQSDVLVTERLNKPPKVETGKFLYRIVSTTPVSIMTGPSFDAPKFKAVLLPEATQEISLRLSFDEKNDNSHFLKLSHRRGWIYDKHYAQKSSLSQIVAVEVPNNTMTADDLSMSGISSVSPSINSRCRHRPPRRRRNNTSMTASERLPPRQIGSIPSSQNAYSSLQEPSAFRFMAPSSNVSILSEDSSFDLGTNVRSMPMASDSFDKSDCKIPCGSFFLMRVAAPKGLKILDEINFQVNHLIRGKNPGPIVSSSHSVSQMESQVGTGKAHHSIFQTMSGRLSTTGPSRSGTPAFFDNNSKTRVLPRGVLFEASKRIEHNGAFIQSAGLIKLSDNSGWAVIPNQQELDDQYQSCNGGLSVVKEGDAQRAYEEVGNAFLYNVEASATRWVRIITRAGVRVHCSPPATTLGEGDTSPSSTGGTSSTSASNTGSNIGPVASSDSDITSSVGSSFLDSMFRTPRRREGDNTQIASDRTRAKFEMEQMKMFPFISCGCIVEVEQWLNSTSNSSTPPEFIRLKGGQGWIPLSIMSKTTAVTIPHPEIRNGSFWFQVQSLRGIKVRSGPSKRAASIKSEEGIHFRFECGEFLRASQVISIPALDHSRGECFAKLYRNRHIQMQAENIDYVKLESLTSQAEWVQVYDENESFMQECTAEPRIERHRQGWRYNVVPDSGVEVRKGPSCSSEKTGVILFCGESILIHERVSSASSGITWLRMKDGQGWVCDVDHEGKSIMIPYSLRYRKYLNSKQEKPEVPREGDDIAYNMIIDRLFHNTHGNRELSLK